MKIVIISGSPKGERSVTLQYLLYIQKHFPEHDYRTFHVGRRIRSIEKNQEEFDEIVRNVKESEAVLWATPVFFLLVPAQLKRFIELVFERGAAKAFAGKYTSAISTSIRFFDTTAHSYLQGVCDDLKMNYVGFSSLDTWDMLGSSKRKQLLCFAKNLFSKIEKQVPVSVQNPPLPQRKLKVYTPERAPGTIDNAGKNILVLTDGYKEDNNLGKMVAQFADAFAEEIKVVNINDLEIKGGCRGCLRCCYDNACVYNDGFVDFWRGTVKEADIIIFAGEIRDRYLSARWKMIFDRTFFMNHTPFLAGKQIGFLISGRFSRIANLHQLFSAYVETQGANLLDFVTDEYGDSKTIDRLIHAMADQAVNCSKQGYIRPHTFHKEGGMKILRDDVYGRLRFVCQADHRWYKANGIYDTFPQKNKFVKKTNRKYMFLTRFKIIRDQFYKNATKELVRPIHKIAVDPNK